MTNQQVLDRQVAEWNAEIARLADLVAAAATGDAGKTTMQMPTHLQAAYDAMPRLPQRQDALNNQLRDLRDIANKLGLYDAADYLRGALERN